MSFPNLLGASIFLYRIYTSLFKDLIHCIVSGGGIDIDNGRGWKIFKYCQRYMYEEIDSRGIDAFAGQSKTINNRIMPGDFEMSDNFHSLTVKTPKQNLFLFKALASSYLHEEVISKVLCNKRNKNRGGMGKSHTIQIKRNRNVSWCKLFIVIVLKGCKSIPFFINYFY
jgi:hypothetical protein